MKYTVLSTLIGIGTISAIATFAAPAKAQFVSIPVTNGSFAVQGTGGGTVYSQPMTLLSPAGSINLTSVPLPASASNPTITTNTPVGLWFGGVSGSASLNDGRTAMFPNGEGYLKLETFATVSGAASSSLLPTATGVTVNYNVQTGSLTVPQNTVSGYTTPQLNIPVTNGSFTINAPTTAQADTITITGLLSPAGTVNLTLTLPDLHQTMSPDLNLLPGVNQDLLLTGVANGTVTLTDGQVATVNNRLVTFTANGGLTVGNQLWYGEVVPDVPTTIQGTITGGSISVPQAAVGIPQPPTQPPIPPSNTVPPTDTSVPPTSIVPPVQVPESVPSVAIVNRDRPDPIPSPGAAPPDPAPHLQVGFTTALNLNDDAYRIVREREQKQATTEIPEVDRSSLEFSRIHPMVNVYNR